MESASRKWNDRIFSTRMTVTIYALDRLHRFGAGSGSNQVDRVDKVQASTVDPEVTSNSNLRQVRLGNVQIPHPRLPHLVKPQLVLQTRPRHIKTRPRVLWPDLSLFSRQEGGQVLRPDFMDGSVARVSCISSSYDSSFYFFESGLLATKPGWEGSSNHRGGFLISI
jgi:hypothetical protein